MLAVFRRGWVRILFWGSMGLAFWICPFPPFVILPLIATGCALLVAAVLLGVFLANAACLLGEWLGRIATRHRFLCPECLSFGPNRYACGSCSQEVETAVGRTGGLVANSCGHCSSRLFRRGEHPGVGLRAYCRCGGASGAFRHSVTTRVIGVAPSVRHGVLAHLEGDPRVTADALHLELLDGDELTMLIPLDLAQHPTLLGIGAKHGVAVRVSVLTALEQIWIDAHATPLETARILDATAVALGGELPPRLELILVGDPGGDLDPALRRRLDTRARPIRRSASLQDLLGAPVRSISPAPEAAAQLQTVSGC